MGKRFLCHWALFWQTIKYILEFWNFFFFSSHTTLIFQLFHSLLYGHFYLDDFSWWLYHMYSPPTLIITLWASWRYKCQYHQIEQYQPPEEYVHSMQETVSLGCADLNQIVSININALPLQHWVFASFCFFKFSGVSF